MAAQSHTLTTKVPLFVHVLTFTCDVFAHLRLLKRVVSIYPVGAQFILFALVVDTASIKAQKGQ